MGTPSEYVVRLARTADSAMLLSWRNDPHTRAMSRSVAVVSPDAHESWMADTLQRVDRYLLIVEVDGTPVATVRFDGGPAEWEASLTVAPEARGRGHAAPALEGALAWLVRRGPVDAVRATVRADNQPSLRTFAAAGFRVVRQADYVELRWLSP